MGLSKNLPQVGMMSPYGSITLNLLSEIPGSVTSSIMETEIFKAMLEKNAQKRTKNSQFK